MSEYTYAVGVGEQLHPDLGVVARMREAGFGDCRFGCKVYADPRSSVRVLGHNSNYGCTVRYSSKPEVVTQVTIEDGPARCEVDHTDGGVCQRVLWRDGSCPGEKDHKVVTQVTNARDCEWGWT